MTRGSDLGVRAGREILQLITNQLSIGQWAQTLSRVRLSGGPVSLVSDCS